MIVRVRFFSLIADELGRREAVLSLSGRRITVQDLVDHLKRLFPRLQDLERMTDIIVLVNGEAVGKDYRIREGDEVALIPPASGG